MEGDARREGGSGSGGGGDGGGGSGKDRAEMEADANRTMSEIVARCCPPLPPKYFPLHSQGVPKIVLMGSGGVGKTALWVWAQQRQFIEHYDTTIEGGSRNGRVPVDGQELRPEILHVEGTAAQSSGMSENHLKEGQGIMLVFSLIARSTFEDLQEVWDAIHSVRQDPIAIVLIGNKDDLGDQRLVSREEAEALAVGWNVPYIETSCKTTHNVEYAFGCLIRFIVELSDPLNKNKKKKKKVKETGSSSKTNGGIKRFFHFGK